MSFQEKRTIFSVISGWIITLIYALYVYETYPDQMWSTPVDFSLWGKIFLILIPVSIGARIIVHIIFHIVYKITTEEEDMNITDERDQLIELKSQRVSHWIFMLGFILAMGSLTIDIPHYYMFLIFFVGGLLSELAQALSALYFYRRGI